MNAGGSLTTSPAVEAKLKLAEEAATAANACSEVHLPDDVFMPLSTLTSTWFGTPASGFRQRLNRSEFDLLVLRAKYERNKLLAAEVVAVLSQ